jgi:hypothetical protein
MHPQMRGLVFTVEAIAIHKVSGSPQPGALREVELIKHSHVVCGHGGDPF